MSNPLLEQHALPPFSRIEPEHIKPAIEALIERNKDRLQALLASGGPYSYDSLHGAIEALEDELSQAWSPVSHLNSVQSSEALREAHSACLPLLSAYDTWRDQNEQLFAAYEALASGEEYQALTPAQRQAVDNAIRDFRLAGVALPSADKARFGEIKSRLSELSAKFRDNVLDATNAWRKEVTAEQLAGLPDNALALARQAAEREGLEGYLITLDFPSYSPVLTYCDDPGLRREVYEASCTRASECGPHGGQWDNAELMVEILDLRRQLAELLGFESYAELSLATKMAESPAQVLGFLDDLAEKALPQARRDWQELLDYAQEHHGADTVNAWDVSYYAEKLKQQRYQVSQEAIRPYLPIDRVLAGLFTLVERLYGVTVEEIEDFDTYHDDLRFFALLRDGEPVARFYLDLYARAHKQGGAWMDGCRVRRALDNGVQLPVVYLVCNFSPPVGDDPALLTHNELTTLFHEFGHGLHHMLTRQDVASVSGINGVAWDAVELPSQFLENWCWEPEALAFISGHYQSGEPLPQALLDKMLAARNFQSAMMMARQLEFALFDFRLHATWQGGDASAVQQLLDSVREQVSVVPVPSFNRFQNAFSHIFAGGYAAGYYSYKWAEVLSADAYSRFEEDGIFNADTGRDFLQEILEVGGAREPMASFVAFRGREPSIEPLLRHSGIAA